MNLGIPQFEQPEREVYTKDRLLDNEREDRYRHISAPGGSVVVTVPIITGGRDYDDHYDRRKAFNINDLSHADLPVDGTELIPLYQSKENVNATLSEVLESLLPNSYSFKLLDHTSDQPLTTLFTPDKDGIWLLVYSVACTATDPGASVGSLSVSFTPQDSSSSPLTQSCDLTTLHSGLTAQAVVQLQANTPITFSFIGGGTYGGAAYNLFVSAIPLFSTPSGNSNLNWIS